MNRFAPLDVTLETLSVQLYPDERILTHADGVGLYDGCSSLRSLSFCGKGSADRVCIMQEGQGSAVRRRPGRVDDAPHRLHLVVAAPLQLGRTRPRSRQADRVLGRLPQESSQDHPRLVRTSSGFRRRGGGCYGGGGRAGQEPRTTRPSRSGRRESLGLPNLRDAQRPLGPTRVEMLPLRRRARSPPVHSVVPAAFDPRNAPAKPLSSLLEETVQLLLGFDPASRVDITGASAL